MILHALNTASDLTSCAIEAAIHQLPKYTSKYKLYIAKDIGYVMDLNLPKDTEIFIDTDLPLNAWYLTTCESGVFSFGA